jgi:serine/threonine protein kinase
VRRFRANIAKFYCAEVVCGISYLHSFNVIYRDLKPENLLLDQDGHVIITDFGLSKMGDNSTDMATTICGTPEYASPEILQQLPCVAFLSFFFSSQTVERAVDFNAIIAYFSHKVLLVLFYRYSELTPSNL